jgi:hypothetical protein
MKKIFQIQDKSLALLNKIDVILGPLDVKGLTSIHRISTLDMCVAKQLQLLTDRSVLQLSVLSL